MGENRDEEMGMASLNMSGVVNGCGWGWGEDNMRL